MKKIIGMFALLLLMTSMSITGVLANEGPGPAPSSGDGSSDGPEWVNEPWEDNGGIGPAPNAGDGIPDGPGW
jgi:hypothetical protein